MAFKDNWPNQLTAVFSADGFSHKLAQDFWCEELFNPECMVRFHWLKLLWVFCVSALVQLTLLTAIVAVPITFYRNGGSDWTLPVIVVLSATAVGLAMAVAISTAVWLDLKRHALRKTKP
jgi:hypothetical protein